MIWADGSRFDGIWQNDKRVNGRMIMVNGYVYIGKFKNDLFHGPNEMLLLPSSTIYQGRICQCRTLPISLLLYPNGSIYYGQHL